jgi:Flp pilus assembly protein protease CpaA
MRHFVESLSLGSGAAIVAVLSALLTWVLFKRTRGREVWLLPLAAPLVVSYSLYWLPVWMGADDEAQFGA